MASCCLPGESGRPKEFEVSGWTAIAAPRGLPKAVSKKIQRDIQKAMAEPDEKEMFASLAYEPFPLSRKQFWHLHPVGIHAICCGHKKAGVSLD